MLNIQRLDRRLCRQDHGLASGDRNVVLQANANAGVLAVYRLVRDVQAGLYGEHDARFESRAMAVAGRVVRVQAQVVPCARMHSDVLPGLRIKRVFNSRLKKRKAAVD